MKPPYSLDGDDILLAVRLTPRARKDGISGVIDSGDGRTALAIRIAAPPVEGAANKALIALLSKRLGIRKAEVTIRSGEASRLKIVRLAGLSEAALEPFL